MQNKYKKHLLITGIVLFLLLQNLSAQLIENGTENSGNKEGKTNLFSEVLMFPTNLTSSVQSSAGGSVSSSSYNNTATAGQPGPVGVSSSSSYNNTSGFISTLASIDVMAPTAPVGITAGGSNPLIP